MATSRMLLCVWFPSASNDGARASSAATDERDLDLVAASGKRGVTKYENANRGRRR